MDAKRMLLLMQGLCFFALACTPDFDKISEVKDLRILAIRAEPPEIIKAVSPEVWPPVKVDALVVDPTLKVGETLEWELWGCAAGNKSSMGDQGDTEGAIIGCCPSGRDVCTQDLERGILKLASGNSTPDKIGTSVVLTKDLYWAALMSDSQKGLGGVPILVELRVRRPGKPWQVGIKRLVYGVYDDLDMTCLPKVTPESLKKCIQAQNCQDFLYVCVRDGVCSICNGVPKEDLETKRPKVANENPAVHYVKVSEGKLKDKDDEDSITIPTTWSSYGDASGSAAPNVWSVKGAKEHFILPKPDPVLGAEREVYVVGSRVPTYDNEKQSFQYTEVLKENLTYHFFTTAGSFSHDTTGGAESTLFLDKKVTEISSRWTPPALDKEGDPETKDATLWVVVQDDRGGIDWMTIHAKIKKAEKKK